MRRPLDEAEMAQAFDLIVAGHAASNAVADSPLPGSLVGAPSVWDHGAPGVPAPLPPAVPAPTAAAAQHPAAGLEPAAGRGLSMTGVTISLVAGVALVAEQLLLGRDAGALPVWGIGAVAALGSLLGVSALALRNRRSVSGVVATTSGLGVALLSVIVSLAIATSQGAVAPAAPNADAQAAATSIQAHFGDAASIGRLTVQVAAPQSFTRTPAKKSRTAQSAAPSAAPAIVEPAVSVVVTITNTGSASLRMPVTVSAVGAEGALDTVLDKAQGIGIGGYRVLAAGDTVSYRLGFAVSDPSAMKVTVRDAAGDTVVYSAR